ncbi:DEAD/DEAH box helicase, partial [Streptomyces neyagawaensis]
MNLAASPADVSELARCHAAFVADDPARTGRFVFRRTDGAAPPPVAVGSAGESTVVRPGETGVELVTVPVVSLPVSAALPVLTRARATAGADRSTVFWGTAAVLALQLVARGLLLPGVTAAGHDAWRIGPLRAEDLERVRELAAAMPPEAHAVPVDHTAPLRLPDPERLLRAFLDTVADSLPRSPAAALAAGGPAFAAREPQSVPEQRAWATDVAAGHDAGVRLSLRLEVPGLASADPDENRLSFRAVLQVHSVSDPALVADASAVWAGAEAFGPRARMDALLALRHAARAWAPLSPLLSAAVPDAVDLADEEVTDLLGEGARTLAATGVDVHWPKELARTLTARAVIGPPDGEQHDEQAADTGSPTTTGPGGFASGTPSFLSADALLTFDWRFSLGDQRLTREELDALAEANRPMVRLRDQWVLVDPEEIRRAHAQRDHKLSPVDALGAALTGSTEIDGRMVDVLPTGWLATLRERLSDPEGQVPVGQPSGLSATLRGYQLRGLGWLARMTSLGLGGCLADDMGLGKTITLIALHLHRQSDASSAGPTLVVCPASLMGNWQREIEKFAPGVPVRRFHGTRRSLDALADGEFVLTTYGTMRLDASRLGDIPWGMVVADEAQHVKNPYSATAKELRTIGARARV